MRQVLRPSLAASAIRLSTCGTVLISPFSPISPNTAERGIGTRSLKLEAIAKAIPRSIAGSLSLNPPVTLTITSWLKSLNPARLVSTAIIRSRRLKSTPLAMRLGRVKLVVVVNACSSTSKGRLPSSVGTTTEPVVASVCLDNKA